MKLLFVAWKQRVERVHVHHLSKEAFHSTATTTTDNRMSETSMFMLCMNHSELFKEIEKKLPAFVVNGYNVLQHSAQSVALASRITSLLLFSLLGSDCFYIFRNNKSCIFHAISNATKNNWGVWTWFVFACSHSSNSLSTLFQVESSRTICPLLCSLRFIRALTYAHTRCLSLTGSALYCIAHTN